jgi:hypothetical protein
MSFSLVSRSIFVARASGVLKRSTCERREGVAPVVCASQCNNGTKIRTNKNENENFIFIDNDTRESY